MVGAEADLLRLVARSRVLPEPRANPAWWPLTGRRCRSRTSGSLRSGLAVQIHSRRYHEGADAWDATVMQDGIFAEHGALLVAVTLTGVDRHPDRVLSRIEGAYRAAAAAPRPSVPLVA